MLRLSGIAIMLLLLFSSAKVKVVNMAQLQATAKKTNDTLYVLNFWATWCKPCVNEMPYFEKSAQQFKDRKVKVVFVSLNSAKELQQVEGFISAKKVSEVVLLLSSGNPNVWIDQVDSSWSGAIPATAMYKGGKKVFFREGEFTQAQLDSIIQTKIKNV